MSPYDLLVFFGYCIGLGCLIGTLVALYNAWRS